MFILQKRSILFASLISIGMVTVARAERIDRGDQVIDGTKVHTEVYHNRGYAVFSNSCGSQRLTQSQLQAGAKPTDIIPCPRKTVDDNSSPVHSNKKRLWAAVAAGIRNGVLGIGAKVSVGLGQDYQTRSEAEAAAVRSCQKNGVTCSVVTAWNAGCYHITVSRNSNNVAWGSGRTAQDAYNACYSRISGGNCDTNTLGGCYPE